MRPPPLPRGRLIDVDLGVCRGQAIDTGSERWVVLLPGANYSPDAPLLRYAREAALAAGFSVLAVRDSFDGTGDPLRWVEERTEAAIDHLEAANQLVLVAKSLTSLAAPLVARLGLPAVWLTPLMRERGTSVAKSVVEGLAAARAPSLLVGGTADETWDPDVARSIPGAEVLEIADADHALQVPGDVPRSLDALRTIADCVADFFRRRADSTATAEAGGDLPRLTGIDHVQLAMPPRSEPAAREFYGSVLGLREVAKPEALAARGSCWFVGPGIHLHLGVADELQPARKAHPAFTVRNLDALRDRITSAGVSVTADDAATDVRRFYVADPFGNRIEFVEHADRGFTEPR